ncbi:hypothetical protein HPB52_022994 [Rhipicephalus sanguineus]|uniref:Uncharacterized protein n=1 Tax=Rhipicephalus sanguineus TaxID=34632 RepID=A0A9D4PPL5_RHISA|nr:hypothetical protein HPB52_022994 [Rhipicephalus sanguineus]
MSQIGVADSVDMTPEEIIDWREKFVHSGAKKPLPTSPSTLTSRPQVTHILPRPPPLPAANTRPFFMYVAASTVPAYIQSLCATS